MLSTTPPSGPARPETLSRAVPSSRKWTPGLVPMALLGGLLLGEGCARGTEADINPGGPTPGGGGGEPVDPPPGPTDFAPLAGLVSAVAGPGVARLEWREPRPSEKETFELALYVSDDRATLYDTPFLTPLSGTSLTLSSLIDGTRLFFGLGIRPLEGGGAGDPVGLGAASFVPTGPVLTATPGPVVYVDSTAPATGADGLTPETAYPDPRLAILVAGFQLGGGNVWLRAGTYENLGFVAQGAGIHVYGGFDENFDIETRDTAMDVTVLNGAPDGSGTPTLMFEMQALPTIPIENPVAIADGLTFAGNGQTFRGVEVTNTAAEFRSTHFRGFRGSGLRLQNSESQDYDVVVTGSNFIANSGEGMDGDGALDIVVDGCAFLSNGTEGFDLDDWIAPPGESVSLRVTGSRFFGNGSEGMDVDLSVPFGVVDLTGGTFSIEIRGCSFERNRLDGCLLDIEYDLFPQWNAEIVVRESLARANGQAGFEFDLDGPASLITHRVVAAGNGAGGIVMGSESDPGTAIVSSSVAVGNGGPGVHAINPQIGVGNRSIVVTHSILAGNGGAGLESQNQRISASSTLSHLQAVDGIEADFRASFLADIPSAELFLNAAEGFARITDAAKGVLTLEADAAFDPGAFLEIADDGTARTASQVDGPFVVVEPVPELVLPPDLLSIFASEVVTEDYRLVSGSPAEGTGLAPPGGPAVDSGVFGAPVPGVPGFTEEIRRELFHPLEVTPPASLALAPTAPIEVSFNEELDPGSVDSSSVRVVDENGAPVSFTLGSAGSSLTLAPPVQGWPAVIWVEILGEVRSLAGRSNVAPLAMRFQS